MTRRARAALPLLFALAGSACLGGDLPSESAGRGEGVPPPGEWALVVANGLGANLREGPSMSHTVLDVVPEGARVRVEGVQEGDYVPVTWTERAGWVYAAFLQPAPQPSALQMAVEGIATLAMERSPGSELAIAVSVAPANGAAGEIASFAGDVRHVSASAAKAIWVAAALDAGVPIDDLEPEAALVFPSSNNDAAGRVIDRLGEHLGGGATEGANAINDFMWSLGMSRSAFQSWSGYPPGVVRHASNAPHALGDQNWDNYFTAEDAVRFLVAIDRGGALGEAETAALGRWMTWTPRAGYGGWLGSHLPAVVRSSFLHKAGWLPPQWFPSYATLTEIGVVQVPEGPRYAVAIFARQRAGDVAVSWSRQTAAVELASCRLYEVIGEVDLGCVDPAPGGDGDGGGSGTTVYCTDPGMGCGGNSPCWPASDCPGSTECDWAEGDWGACR